MTHIRTTVAWVGGLAALCALLVAGSAWRWAERTREVASAAIGPGSGAEGYWTRDLADAVVAAEIGNRSRVTGGPASGPESPEVDPGERFLLLPIPQPDVARERPLVGLGDRGASRLEVDAECRPIQATQTLRLNDRGNTAEDRGGAAAEGGAGGKPTLAPAPPPEPDAGRRVIRVVVEAEQAAWTQDAHQP